MPFAMLIGTVVSIVLGSFGPGYERESMRRWGGGTQGLIGKEIFSFTLLPMCASKRQDLRW